MYLHPLPDNVSQPGDELLVEDVVVAGAGVTVVIHQGRVLRIRFGIKEFIKPNTNILT